MTLPKLFQPLELRGVTARNHIVVSPMCQYKSVGGMPTDWQLVNAGRYAIGGAGIVFHEETAVEERGRKTHDCAGLWRDAQIPAYRRITQFLKDYGAVPAMQLGHAGGKASERGPLTDRQALTEEDKLLGRSPWRCVSASAVPARNGLPIPHELSRSEIANVVAAWAEAAHRSLLAGYEVLEIHGAHGYLIQQFLSPLTNHRQDAYGGSRKNRMRFAIEVTEAVRTVWPSDKPLFFRVSSVDGQGGHWTIEDTVALAVELLAAGVDVIDCSSGGLTGSTNMPMVPRVPGYHLHFAKHVKEETGARTMAPGLITLPRQAEDVLNSGAVDMIGMARELMYCSEWPVHAARELGADNYLNLFPPDFTFRLEARIKYEELPQNRLPAVSQS